MYYYYIWRISFQEMIPSKKSYSWEKTQYSSTVILKMFLSHSCRYTQDENVKLFLETFNWMWVLIGGKEFRGHILVSFTSVGAAVYQRDSTAHVSQPAFIILLPVSLMRVGGSPPLLNWPFIQR